jgi:hypothetical protein
MLAVSDFLTSRSAYLPCHRTLARHLDRCLVRLPPIQLNSVEVGSLMWYPNRGQWLVIWLVVPIALLIWAGSASDSSDTPGRVAVVLLSLGALLVWKLARPSSKRVEDPPPRAERVRGLVPKLWAVAWPNRCRLRLWRSSDTRRRGRSALGAWRLDRGVLLWSPVSPTTDCSFPCSHSRL